MLLSHAEEGETTSVTAGIKKKKLPEWANSVKLNSFMLEFFDCRLCVTYPALGVCFYRGWRDKRGKKLYIEHGFHTVLTYRRSLVNLTLNTFINRKKKKLHFR